MMTRIRELVELLGRASHAYYQEDKQIISDFEYDKLYDELVTLEKESGIILAGSPTQKVGYEVVSNLTKAQHNEPMLSLNKTKEPETLAAFLQEREGLLAWKLDGLSIALKYENGTLSQALTRGNGTVGEDVTHNAKVFANIPLNIPYPYAFTVRGEAVITYKDFDAINADEEIKYKNPRNLCSGAVRQLNSENAAKRRVLFYAFGASGYTIEKKSEQLKWLSDLGFAIVEHNVVTADNVVSKVAEYKEKVHTLPVATDGLVLTFDDIAFSKSLGTTSKFPRDSIALKWTDEIAETELIDIEWSTSRTGLINPVAIFKPVDIEGSSVSRASLHNVSILKSLGLKIGDHITVYKANMIIPQIAENLSKSNHPNAEVEIPETCAICGANAEIIGNPETLYCTNPNCDAQKTQSLSHFVSRDALNISGLSKQTLEKLEAQGFVNNYMDLFSLQNYRDEIITIDGFGEKSYTKLITAIENAKDVPLHSFLYALGIKHVGLANAKLLCQHLKYDANQIVQVCKSSDYLEKLLEIKGFGDAIAHSLNDYFTQDQNITLYQQALETLRIASPPQALANLILDSKTFVITGDLTQFSNRKELQIYIEQHGGRVTSSVSASTSYLINNNVHSTSGKNKKATDLSIPIISEAEFMEMCKYSPTS